MAAKAKRYFICSSQVRSRLMFLRCDESDSIYTARDTLTNRNNRLGPALPILAHRGPVHSPPIDAMKFDDPDDAGERMSTDDSKDEHVVPIAWARRQVAQPA